MAFDRSAYAEGIRASLPVLLGIVPFGVITGVAMVASGIAPRKQNEMLALLAPMHRDIITPK